MDKNGATSVLKSVGKLSNERVGHGCVLNQLFHPSIFSGNDSVAAISAYMKSAVDVGAWETQFNVISTDALREAQKTPPRSTPALLFVLLDIALILQSWKKICRTKLSIEPSLLISKSAK